MSNFRLDEGGMVVEIFDIIFLGSSDFMMVESYFFFKKFLDVFNELGLIFFLEMIEILLWKYLSLIR